MSSQQLFVITNVDSQCGFALAYRLLVENRSSGNQNFTIRLLCRNNEDMEPLVKLGGDVRQVDYNREDQLRECFRNAKAVVLIPEHDQQRRQLGENVIKSAKNENVGHLCMISMLGANKVEQNDQQFHHLCEYRQLEEKVKETMGNEEKCSIVRVPAPSQFFYYMAPTLQSQGSLRLPIKKEKKWSPVNLVEVVEAIVKLANQEQGNHLFSCGVGQNKQVYQFTPRQQLGMDELTKEISQGLGGNDIKYEQVSRDEVKKMLQRMRDDRRFKERPQKSSNSVDATGRRDKPYAFPLGRYLNDELIDTLCEIWELVNQDRFDIITDDLKQVLGREPQDIRSFFKNNRDQFNDLR
ncbi:hypothetical protein BCR42DRAFT_364029 [Absidia repens]|uniref:NAD(P)-binding domain-containing protein n=1 Tax=Absidia repens TaxID=90262 RepID=A0A1X2J1C0_9FUNG|nr:hypothetical protein BCR42DRAFT_364029 [Absidia repens]